MATARRLWNHGPEETLLPFKWSISAMVLQQWKVDEHSVENGETRERGGSQR